jgi:hypothetical protein
MTMLNTYAGHRPTPLDGHICGELDALLIAPVSRTRDSGILTESNWAIVTEAILKLAQHEETQIYRFGHWGPGWYELLLIHPDDTAAVACAEEWARALADYPVASDSDYSEREWTEASNAWARMHLKDRIATCTKYRHGIFAARHDEIPENIELSYLVGE